MAMHHGQLGGTLLARQGKLCRLPTNAVCQTLQLVSSLVVSLVSPGGLEQLRLAASCPCKASVGLQCTGERQQFLKSGYDDSTLQSARQLHH